MSTPMLRKIVAIAAFLLVGMPAGMCSLMFSPMLLEVISGGIRRQNLFDALLLGSAIALGFALAWLSIRAIIAAFRDAAEREP